MGVCARVVLVFRALVFRGRAPTTVMVGGESQRRKDNAVASRVRQSLLTLTICCLVSASARINVSSQAEFLAALSTTVTNDGDSVYIHLNNNPSETDGISDAVCSSTCCYVLSSEIIISGRIVIDGVGSACTIAAHSATRLFRVTSSGHLTIKSIVLRHGREENGAAVYLEQDGSNFVGDKVYFDDNVAHVIGGAVYVSNHANFLCDKCSFTNNKASVYLNYGASVFGQKHGGITCNACEIENASQLSAAKAAEIAMQSQFAFSFDLKLLSDL